METLSCLNILSLLFYQNGPININVASIPNRLPDRDNCGSCLVIMGINNKLQIMSVAYKCRNFWWNVTKRLCSLSKGRTLPKDNPNSNSIIGANFDPSSSSPDVLVFLILLTGDWLRRCLDSRFNNYNPAWINSIPIIMHPSRELRAPGSHFNLIPNNGHDDRGLIAELLNL